MDAESVDIYDKCVVELAVFCADRCCARSHLQQISRTYSVTCAGKHISGSVDRRDIDDIADLWLVYLDRITRAVDR